MFLTFEHGEVPPGVPIDNGRTWRYVEYLSSYPYFHVSALARDDAEVRETTLLIYTVYDLVDLSLAKPQGWEILEVRLVSPRCVNKGQGWQMDALRCIEEVECDGRLRYVYLLKSGETYFDRDEIQGLPREARRLVYADCQSDTPS
ncbi:hypothetical protein [Pseudomonas nitroreducens]|uniref:hypothetical protein n=1 Tax=Pseudomonas nitroreducens TaxID=46680 RepID=UPI0038290472